jgi:HlyD family secretion protein
MDVKREGAGRKRLIRRIIYGTLLVAVIVGATVAVGKLKPAVPTVEGSTLWPDTVRRGPMLRQVRGLGTLVPEQVLWIPADTDGRVSKINVHPGAPVRPDTIILEMENPDVKLAELNAEFDLKAGEANLIDLRVRLESESYDQKSIAATVNSDYVQANMQADRDKKLAQAGLIPDLQRDMSSTKAQELSTRNKIELDRAKIVDASVQAQLDAQKVKVEQLRAVYQLKKQQVEQLRVRAGTTGILQALGPPTAAGATAPPLEVGQKVMAGTILAKIAQPEKLKAELKITETEAKDIAMGQEAEIDTRNGVIPGKVIRIDPASINGTVTVDVGLTGELPLGARPDLSVDGTIQLEKLSNILFVGRPVFGQPNADVMIFRYEPDGRTAIKTKVKLGRASVNTIEVVSGLREGDKVILSDMNAYDSHDRIRVN